MVLTTGRLLDDGGRPRMIRTGMAGSGVVWHSLGWSGFDQSRCLVFQEVLA